MEVLRYSQVLSHASEFNHYSFWLKTSRWNYPYKEDKPYCDMFKILTKFMRTRNNLPFGNPLFQVFNLTVQFVEFQNLSELISSLKGQILETGIQFINLGLLDSNGITEIRADIIA